MCLIFSQIMFGDTIHVPENEYKNEATLQLMKLIVEKKRELDMCFVIMETALYLLWAHLDYFTLQCMPSIGSSVADSNHSVSSCK